MQDVSFAPKAVYARISEDDPGEATESGVRRDADAPARRLSGLGVARQVSDGRAICERREWRLEEYVDNDYSAYDKKVVRPEFERMLADLAAERLSGIVVYNLDRLARQPRDLERVIDLYEDNASLTFDTLDGGINLATDDGRAMARVMVTFANKASADTGRRTKRKHLELAEAGEPVGRRTFGWKSDKRTLDPVEAAHARRAVDDLLCGLPQNEIVRGWNANGVKTTTGAAWSRQALVKYMQNPRLVGERTRYGKVFLDERGRPVRGTWEPLLDRDTFDRLQMVMGGGSSASGGRRGARKYHLTGLLRCGLCNGLMFGSTAREGERFNYICNVSNGERGLPSHRVAVSGLLIDQTVDAMVFARLSGAQVKSAEPKVTWEKAERLETLQSKKDELMTAFTEGVLDGATVFPRVGAIDIELKELQAERTAWLLATTGPKVERHTPESWEALSAAERRVLADKALETVYVKRAAYRGARFTPSRLEPVWRD